jgi:hypothetical protein
VNGVLAVGLGQRYHLAQQLKKGQRWTPQDQKVNRESLDRLEAARPEVCCAVQKAL